LKPLFFNETNNRKKQEYKNQIDELINKDAIFVTSDAQRYKKIKNWRHISRELKLKLQWKFRTTTKYSEYFTFIVVTVTKVLINDL